MRPHKREEWVYPHSANTLKAAGLCSMAECLAKRKANIVKTIEGHKVSEECREQRGGEDPHPACTDGSNN